VEQNFSWESNRSSASQDFPRILWSPKVHHCFHYSPSPVPIPSRIVLVQAQPTSVLLSTSTSDFHTITLNAPLSFFVRATRLAHQIQEHLLVWTLCVWNLYRDLLSLGKYIIYC
jgi:HPt (histidine-containing phosphotransfer) domain-containing protein